MRKMIKPILVGLLLIICSICMLTGCKKAKEYTVIFDSFGGTSVDSQVVKEGEAAKKPEDPVKEGFTFVEWQYENATYNFDAEVSQDITLTAFYTINEGTEVVMVAFNADNGKGVSAVEVAKGYSISEPPTPEKAGYIFEGWYFEEKKFDFTTKITENIVLVAKWSVDENASSEEKEDKNSTSNKKQNGEGTHSSNTNNNLVSSSDDADHMIKFSDVEGIWYAEGTDDVTIEFAISSLNASWIDLNAANFDYHTGKIALHTEAGGNEYYYNNGYFFADNIELNKNGKLIYSVNNTKTAFYRQKNYPKATEWPHEILVREIDGYYWYLDGYEYTYLYPTVIPWYDHECLSWESQHISITSEKLVAFENFDRASYKEYNGNASSNTHNTLMKNPVDFADRLIEEYKMKVVSNKLYMTIGGKEYSFTRHNAKKPIKTTIEVDKKSIVVERGQKIVINVNREPWWCDERTIDCKASGTVKEWEENYILNDGSGDFDFYAEKAGSGTITIQDSLSETTVKISVTVNPISVKGISLNKSKIELEKGSTETLKATISPSNADNENIIWSSSDSNIVSVSPSGKVKAVNFGTATITAKAEDGGHVATCIVTVKELPLAADVAIGVSTRFNGSSHVIGIIARIEPTGGSENYASYSVKLYRDGVLVGEGTEKELFVTPAANGTYRAEVYVKDSNGKEVTATSTVIISELVN